MEKLLFILFLILMPSLLFSQAQEATLLGRWENDTLTGSTNHTNIYNEIWGYAVNDAEFAIIGSTAGTHFIDVTIPSAPIERFFVPGGTQGGSIVHRDFHDYKGYLYAAAGEGGNSTLQIIDMRFLPDSISVVYNQNDVFQTAHNIFIDSSTAKLYVLTALGRQNGYAPMRIFDLSNPELPVLMGTYNDFGGIRPSHVHDAYVQNDIAFLNLGNDGMAIIDYSNMQNPKAISTLTEYPSRGYNHSGWISDDCQTYYLADENHGFDLKVIDISELCEPEIITTFNADVMSPSSITHNQLVACDYLYVSYYYDGLRVYDIADPEKPTLVRYFDTYSPPDGRQYRGAWGVYPFLPSGNILLSDMQSGLFVFEGMRDNCNAVTQTNNCLRSQLCNSTSTNELELNPILQLAPNPTKETLFFSINLSLALKHLDISLLSIDGKLQKAWKKENLRVGENDFSILLPNSLAKGVYFISLGSEQFQLTKKIIIEP